MEGDSPTLNRTLPSVGGGCTETAYAREELMAEMDWEKSSKQKKARLRKSEAARAQERRARSAMKRWRQKQRAADKKLLED